jgi:predicted ATPase
VTELTIPLVQGLAASGRPSEAITLVDATIALVETKGNFSHMSELLRVKGGVLLSMRPPHKNDAEQCFLNSLDWSRRQGALAWELRTATDLAALLAATGEFGKARAILQPVVGRFSEGVDFSDLKSAHLMLASFS